MTRAATLCSRWLPLLVTLYTIARFALVAGELGRQGVNPWIFALLDVGTAWPYGVLLARVLRTFAADGLRGCAAPAVPLLVLAAAPYGYVLGAASGLGVVAVAAITAVALAGASASVAAVQLGLGRQRD